MTPTTMETWHDYTPSRITPDFFHYRHCSDDSDDTSDSITARLSAGEFVMPAMQTQQYLPALNAMRDGDFSIEGASNRFDAQPPRAPQIIEVRGIDPEKFYTGDNIRYLIEGLNTALADGYVLKVKRA